MSRLLIILAIVAVIIVGAAVLLLATNRGVETPSQKISVKIGTTVAYYEALIPLLVADSMGYFSAEGLNVTLVGYQGGADARKALVAKEVDFIAQSSVHAGIAQSAGADVVIVMSLHEVNTIDLCARTGINSIQDLRGKVVGVTVEGSLSWASAVGYLSREGLKPGEDVKIIGIGSDPAVIVSSLQQGKIDAFACWTNIYYILVKNNISKPLLNIITDPKVHEKYLGTARIVEVAILSLRDDAKREAAVKVKNALKKALEYINSHSEPDIADAVMKSKFAVRLLGDIKREDLIAIIQLLKPGYSKDGSVWKEGWDKGTYSQLLQPSMSQQLKPVPFEKVVWQGVTDVK